MSNWSVAQLAHRLQRPFRGDGEISIRRFASLHTADSRSLSFAIDSIPKQQLQKSRAAALLISPELYQNSSLEHLAAILTPDPYGDMERLMVELYRHPLQEQPSIIHSTATIHHTAVVEGSVGEQATIGPFCWVARGSRIGAGCRLDGGAMIYAGVDLGAHSHLLAHAVVGSQGFGFRATPQGETHPVVHRAGVTIGERCIIGAHSVVAAGFLEPTTLGVAVALDSSVQVAHNVQIGDGSQLAAHVDLAGHCILGKGVRMGGGAQVSGGVKVGDGATLLASAGATKEIPPGETWSGFPARPLWEWRRSLVQKKR